VTKKVLIIKGHPREESFCNALVAHYIEGANTNGVEIQILELRTLELEPWLKYDWSRNHDSLPASADLDRSKELITWADHIVFAYPTYWAAPPALVKLWLEMVITAHFAFRYKKPFLGKLPHWNRLLTGRTATIISTMDAPPLVMDVIDLDPGGKMLHDILRFCGIKLKRKFYAGSVVLSSVKKREQWLAKAYRIGQKDTCI
jgi:NAD(P)H dehydrogenase (quinone)